MVTASDSSNYSARTWHENLTDIGSYTAAAADTPGDRKLTVVVCVPRIEFAAVVCALGILRSKFAKEPASNISEGERLQSLVGRCVTYANPWSGRIEAGRLERISSGSDPEAFILRFKRTPPDFDAMSKEQKHRFAAAAVMSSSIGLRETSWSTIRPLGREVSVDRRISKIRVAKANEGAEALSDLHDEFSIDLDEGVLSKRLVVASIVGNMSRLRVELEAELGFRTKVKLGPILRPATRPDYSDSAHITLNSSASQLTQDGAPLVLIEAGRNLADQLQLCREMSRVVFIARNAPSYADCAELLMDQYLSTDKENRVNWPKEPRNPIKIISFYHQ